MSTAEETHDSEYRPISKPYPGLRPFRADEQPIFFGRSQQAREILDKLEQTQFAVVVGGSGSGKSSLLRAGVLPELRAKGIEKSGDFWLVADFTPKDRPFDYLVSALAGVIEPAAGETEAKHEAAIESALLVSNSLGAALEQYRDRLSLEKGLPEDTRDIANILIICDQFEEIFRSENDAEAKRQAGILVDLIINAYENRAKYPRLFVIIGMRSDDLHRSAVYVRLPNVINAASYLTRRLAQMEIAEAIIEPARFVLRDLYRKNGKRPPQYQPVAVDSSPFEPAMMKMLYDEVAAIADDPDHLPLLQHLLSVIWEHVKARAAAAATSSAEFRITAADFAAALGFKDADAMMHAHTKQGGLLARALDTQANAALGQNPDCKALAEIMFRLLASQDDKGSYKRRWTSRQEIAAVAREATPAIRADRRDIAAVIRAFTVPYPFLYVQGPSDDAKIDVSHESFIRTWQTFRDWLAEERALAGAFIDLKKDYVHRQERYADQAQPLLRRLMSRLGRLSDDRIKASEGWWHNRKNNSAWAERYKFSNLDREQIGTPHRGFLLEQEPSLQELRRYRWRSTLQSSVRSYLPIGALGAVAIAALGWGVTQYNYSQALLKTQWERTQSMAYGIESRVSERVVDSTHPARLWETLVAVESFLELDHRRRQPRSPISNWFRSVSSWLTDSELTSGLYSQAVHRAARRVMYATIWPRLDIVAPRDGDKEPALNTEIPKACGENFKNVPESVMQTYKERTGTGPDAILHQVTDFRNGGNEDRIALVTTSSADSTALHLIAIRLSQPDGASQRCDVEYIFQVPVGPGNVKIDGELRFIVVNWELRPSPHLTTQSDAPVQVAWLARLGWLRDCSANLTDDWKCADGTAYAYDGDNIPLTIPIGGPYSITAEGFVKDNFGQYWEVQFDDKPRLLTPKETSQQANKISATRASLSIESGGKNLSREQLAVFCNQSDRHLAILKERPRSWARQYRLQVFELGSEHDKTKCGPNSPYLKGESAGSLFELQFSAPPLVDVSFDQDDRSSVVVHSAVGVMHRISWDLRRFHKRLCTSLRSQRDQITEALKGGLPSEWQALSPELSRAFKEKDNLVHKLQLPLCAEGTDDRWTPARGAAPSARPSTR